MSALSGFLGGAIIGSRHSGQYVFCQHASSEDALCIIGRSADFCYGSYPHIWGIYRLCYQLSFDTYGKPYAGSLFLYPVSGASAD